MDYEKRKKVLQEIEKDLEGELEGFRKNRSMFKEMVTDPEFYRDKEGQLNFEKLPNSELMANTRLNEVKIHKIDEEKHIAEATLNLDHFEDITENVLSKHNVNRDNLEQIGEKTIVEEFVQDIEHRRPTMTGSIKDNRIKIEMELDSPQDDDVIGHNKLGKPIRRMDEGHQ